MTAEEQVLDALIENHPGPPEQLRRTLGEDVDVRALFALELVLGPPHCAASQDAARLRSWLLAGHVRPITPGDLQRRSRDLRKKLDNWKNSRKRGRSDAVVGAHEIRKVVPALIFDRSVFLVPPGPNEPDPIDHPDEILVDWLRSHRVAEMMDIVTGRRPDIIKMRCSDGDFNSFLSLRALPFQRVRVLFHPEDEGYLGAVAMVPGAQPGRALTIDLTGFAGDPQELLTRWFGKPMGSVLDIQTVPAG